METPPIEVTCTELKQRRDADEPLLLLDCREPHEHQIARLSGALLVPMGTVPSRLEELAAEPRPIVVYCHHGMRSLQVAQWLRQQGVEGVQSLAGGIDAWAEQIDPTTPRY